MRRWVATVTGRPGGVACERWVLAAYAAHPCSDLLCRRRHEACAVAVSELSADLNIFESVDHLLGSVFVEILVFTFVLRTAQLFLADEPDSRASRERAAAALTDVSHSPPTQPFFPSFCGECNARPPSTEPLNFPHCKPGECDCRAFIHVLPSRRIEHRAPLSWRHDSSSTAVPDHDHDPPRHS